MNVLRSWGVALIVAFAGCAGDVEPRVRPVSGRQAGLDDIRIEGSGFSGHGGATVHFGTDHALAVVIEGDRLIRCKTPKTETVGQVDVQVTFDDQTGFTIPGGFTFEEGQGIKILAGDR